MTLDILYGLQKFDGRFSIEFFPLVTDLIKALQVRRQGQAEEANVVGRNELLDDCLRQMAGY